MKKFNKAITLASIALALDVLLFIIVAMIIFNITNIWLTLVLGVLIYILGYDAWKATTFIMNYFIIK